MPDEHVAEDFSSLAVVASSDSDRATLLKLTSSSFQETLDALGEHYDYSKLSVIVHHKRITFKNKTSFVRKITWIDDSVKAEIKKYHTTK